MTINVTIKHDTPGFKHDIVVRPCNVVGDKTEYAGAAYDKVLKAGESCTIAVWPGRILSIDEQQND